MNKIFYKGAATKVILNLNDIPRNLLKISRLSSLSYSHVVKIIKFLENKDLVIRNKIGRETKVNLTEKGKNIKELLIKLDSNL